MATKLQVLASCTSDCTFHSYE